MTTPGRNDPCPCGSGQKYKKCCLAREHAVARPRLAPRDTVIPALVRFAETSQFDSDHAIAGVLFWTDRLKDCSPKEAQELLTSQDSSIKYNTWFLFDLDIDEGRSVADLFLEKKGRLLDSRERAFLDRMRASHLRLYEIEGVTSGEGLHLLDLWTKKRLFVRERTGSTQLVRWDVLGARVVPDDDGVLLFEGGLYLYPASAKRDLTRDLKRLHRTYTRNFPEENDAAFFKRHGMIFHHAWLDLVALRPLPRLVTAEGDEMLFAKSMFDLHDEAALRRTLADRDDVDTQDDGSFVWHEQTADFPRSLGTLTIERARVVVETTSKARASRARTWLEGIAGAAVRHRATAFETVASALAKQRAAPPSSSPPVPPEAEAEILQEGYDRHYRAWLDMPLRALANRTPCQSSSCGHSRLTATARRCTRSFPTRS